VPTFACVESLYLPGTTSEGKDPLSTQVIARTRAKTSAVPRPVSEVCDASQALKIVLDRLEEMKAEDIVTIDLTGKTSIADFMVVATGRSNRHVGSVAEDVVEHLKAAGLKNIRVEGQPHCDWVLVDAGDLIVHVFRAEVREFYAIEKMWAGGKGQKPDAAQRKSS
jgi:ribosome-associated protein